MRVFSSSNIKRAWCDSYRHVRPVSSSPPSVISCHDIFREDAYIDGKWIASPERFEVKNPATGSVIAAVPKMTVADVQRVSEVSFNSWTSWKKTTPAQRSAVLMKMHALMLEHMDDLARILTLEAGKPLAESKGEIMYAASMYKFFAEEARRAYGTVIPSNTKGRVELVFREPVGPAVLITPWNFPSAMITRKVGPALAAGCTVVIKPSEETPLSALALCAIAEKAGLPAGVINCITVDRENIAAVGNAFCHTEKFRKLSFTGSTEVGKKLMRECATTVKKVSMELGGNAPFIVFDDADLQVAVKALLASKFRNAGQTCISSNRILVQSQVYDEFADLLSAKVKSMRLGNGMEDGVVMGPLINKQGLDKVIAQVADCSAKGAGILVGGDVADNLNLTGGTFFKPTVLRGFTQEMLPATEETFGPLAPLMMFSSEEEAISIANNTKFGLAAYACTKDLGRAFRIAEHIEAGMIGINEGVISAETTPFGGIKESGIGREGSFVGIDEYLEYKYTCMGLSQ